MVRTRVAQAFRDMVKELGLTLGHVTPQSLPGNASQVPHKGIGNIPDRKIVKGTIWLGPYYKALDADYEDIKDIIFRGLLKVATVERNFGLEAQMHPERLTRSYAVLRQKSCINNARENDALLNFE